MSQPCHVSVILCTYNREQWIGDAIRSLLDLRTEEGIDYEIVVVDNASTDNTPAVIAEIAKTAERPVRYLRETKQGASAARNRGIAEAKGEWLAFMDDDERADPDWLLELLAIAAKKKVRVSGGAVRLVSTEPDARAAPPMLQRVLNPAGWRTSECRFGPRYALHSGSQLVHRSVFEEVGVYDETSTQGCEDTELFTRMHTAGIEAWYTPKAVVLHHLPDYRLSAGYIQWLSLRQGFSIALKDIEQRGAMRAMIIAALRCLRSAVLSPLLLLARLRRNDDHVLYRRSQMWRTQGYVRGTLRTVAPRWFAQERFLSRIEFRNERQQFA